MSLCNLLRHTLVVHVDAVDVPSSLDSFLGHGHPVAAPAQDDVVGAHLSLPHLVRVPVKGPVLQTVRPLPLHAVVPVLVLVPELDGDLVVGEGEQLLAKTVVGLLFPLLGEELDDLLGPHEELVPVAPDRVGRVAVGDLSRVTGVPHVLGELDLLLGRREGEGRFERGHLFFWGSEPWSRRRLR